MATIVAAVAARVAGAAVRSYGRRGGVRLAAVACTRAGARSGVHSRAALAGARSIAGTSAAGAPTAAAPPPVVAVDTSVAEGRVWVVSIERPAVRNAVDRRTADALTAVFTAFDADATACVAVLAGSGGTFCAGADLKAFSDDVAAANRLEPVGAGDGPMGPSRMLLTKPVIAAIDGYAVAGGLELALWADLRVADDTAVLGVHCRRWGVPLIDGGTVRLPRLIGRSRALDLIRACLRRHRPPTKCHAHPPTQMHTHTTEPAATHARSDGTRGDGGGGAEHGARQPRGAARPGTRSRHCAGSVAGCVVRAESTGTRKLCARHHVHTYPPPPPPLQAARMHAQRQAGGVCR